MSNALNWNMDRVFEGGSHSVELQDKLTSIEKAIQEAKELVENWSVDQDEVGFPKLKDFLEKREFITNGLSEAGTFARGLASADAKDAQASKVVNQLGSIASQMNAVETRFMKQLKDSSDEAWNKLLSDDSFKDVSFALNEKREQGRKLLSENEERVIQKLSLDGLHGFGNMYQSLVNSIKIPVKEDGKVKVLSAGQAANKLSGDSDPKARHTMLHLWEKAWQAKSPLFADTLNHLAGFRLQTYQLRSEDDFMNPPLEYNRMKEDTLNVMWDTITENKPRVVDFLNRKAKLMNLEKLSWPDVAAPVSVGTFTPKTYSFEEAQDFIVKHFGSFSTEMSGMAQRAFENNWVEAEDREGKRPGAYCANLPESKESRIFMTFSGSANNVSTLAHELGHAFHSHVMRDLPQLNRRYAMNVAETASTFAETLISNATIEAASSVEEKIALLDSKISRAAIMFMDIHSRFIFEKRFYEKRQNGLVNEKELRDLMEEAQKEAFQDSLETYHPMFWASKLHFYSTSVSFYNFPYTFGFLFSLGIYSKAKEVGPSFEGNYRNLLRDTASMTTEELAEKHLNVDLTQSTFWQSAIDEVLEDIDLYMSLTENYS
ncbi:M3 family oligoendopeptidase [Alkalibacterium sp. MB6]|uniref:M3 family oligoendopeptidase n=1 Tax=Alkalibacterium sp. MB6 TaxID=2081965 RepID=UPI00137A1E0F|nr:M3 family oligoendopeptidase [Alkalibacterium sp. MB6]